MAPTTGYYMITSSEGRLLNRSSIEDRSLLPKALFLLNPDSIGSGKQLELIEDNGKYLMKAGGSNVGEVPSQGRLSAALIPGMGHEVSEFELDGVDGLYKIHNGDRYICEGEKQTDGNYVKFGSKDDALSFRLVPLGGR